MKDKFLKVSNWMVCLLLPIFSFFLFGCPSLAIKQNGVNYFYDGFSVFSVRTNQIDRLNIGWQNSQLATQIEGAGLTAGGVFNCLMLMCAFSMLAIALVYVLAKRKTIKVPFFDRKSNLDILIASFTTAFFAFGLFSLICFGSFCKSYNAVFVESNIDVGGGAVMLFVFALVFMPVSWSVYVLEEKQHENIMPEFDNDIQNSTVEASDEFQNWSEAKNNDNLDLKSDKKKPITKKMKLSSKTEVKGKK